MQVLTQEAGNIVEGRDNARSLLRDSDIQDLESGSEPALRVMYFLFFRFLQSPGKRARLRAPSMKIRTTRR